MKLDDIEVVDMKAPRYPLIVKAAVKDALECRPFPSMDFKSEQQKDLYDMCLASILWYMRGYRQLNENSKRSSHS